MNTQHEYAFVSTESLTDRMERGYNDMVARDKEAKEEGTLIGRYLKERAADGYAFYQIVGEDSHGLQVERLDIYDGWSVPMYEGMSNCFPKHYAEQNIAARESIEGMFS